MEDRALTDLAAQPPGATPLEPDDLEGLIPSWITTRGELNQVEADNILRGRIWAFGGRAPRSADWLLSRQRLHELHRRMLGEVWRWAGKQRQRETNIGIDPHLITTAVHDLCENVQAQIGDGISMAYEPIELAARFHHQLVSIHPYPNGNGRHARLATDVLVGALGVPAFTWGSGVLDSASEVRDRYLAALRAADGGDYDALIDFVRT